MSAYKKRGNLVKTEVMPEQRNNHRALPSAPPIHLMFDGTRNEPSGAPPSYAEAIADRNAISQTSQYSQRTPRSHSRRTEEHLRESNQLSRSNRNTQHHHSYQSIDSLGLSSRNAGNHSSGGGGGRNNGHGDRTHSSRFRSASPDQISDDLQRNSGGSNGVTSSNRKKKPGSKVKKGLENIAFFIIQILD